MRTSNIKTKTVLKADSDDYVNVKKSRAEKDFDNIIEKCKANGWLNVIDFLRDKATNSIRTAIGYWTGISHLDDFIQRQYDHGYDAQTIIEPLKQERIDIYNLLRLFKQYMIYEYPKISKNQITVGSVINYIKSAKSYFMFSDIDIIEHKFKQRVKMPRLDKEDEQAIDTNDVIEILHHTDNRRLKAYLLVLASGGMRAVEALAIRECDIDWSGINFTSSDLKDKLEPARVHIRKEYCKTRRSRDIFISNEAARFLNEWLDWKYRLQGPNARQNALAEGELVFSRVGRGREADPARMYTSMALEFSRVLDKIKTKTYGVRKEISATGRRLVTLHSFRRFCKTVIESHSSENYSCWFLGHAKSSYWVKKEEDRRQIYRDDIQQYLTFLDYPALEQTAKNFEDRLKAEIKKKDEQIELLKQRGSMATDTVGNLSDIVMQLKQEVEQLKKNAKS